MIWRLVLGYLQSVSIKSFSYDDSDKIRREVLKVTVWYILLVIGTVLGNILMHWGIGNVSDNDKAMT
jgi:hypothetical protein